MSIYIYNMVMLKLRCWLIRHAIANTDLFALLRVWFLLMTTKKAPALLGLRSGGRAAMPSQART